MCSPGNRRNRKLMNANAAEVELMQMAQDTDVNRPNIKNVFYRLISWRHRINTMSLMPWRRKWWKGLTYWQMPNRKKRFVYGLRLL